MKKKFETFNLTTRNNNDEAITLVPLSKKELPRYRKLIGQKESLWLKNLFSHGPHQREERHNSEGFISQVVVAAESDDDDVKNPYNYVYTLAEWPKSLRNGTYALTTKVELTPEQKYNLLLGWGLGAYAFDKYKTKLAGKEQRPVRLVIPEDVDKKSLYRELDATYWVQDMINEPQCVLSPEGLTNEALKLAERFNASAAVIKGKDLEKENYPLIYAVGKGAAEEPRLVDILWGDPKDPLVTIVGKGVTFDEGGVNNKDDQEMRIMKNDMAGAAHALGLAQMVMDAKLPVRLRVLLPIVDNAATNKSYRQGDIIPTRKGETMEVVHTDAEGRVILSDALYEAANPVDPNNKPDLITSFGTLSWFGQTQLPGFGTVASNKKYLQEDFMAAVAEKQEYFSPRPLMRRLMNELKDESVGDFRQCNDSHDGYDDLLAIALLHHHVGDKVDWVHMDLQSWRDNNGARTQYPPHLAAGGFAQGMRSAFHMLQKRYGGPQPS